MTLKIMSGGQTGVDRAALDAAMEAGWDHGGWCPRGRLAEDGVIAPRYQLSQTPSADYFQRTEWNVRDSDGTLVLFWGKPQRGKLQGGTGMTVDFCEKYQKPRFLVDMIQPIEPSEVRNWMNAHAIRVLNVAGPRGSRGNHIYEEAKDFLRELMALG